ncbi:MAG: LolA family protein [Bacteroidota bacterium]
MKKYFLLILSFVLFLAVSKNIQAQNLQEVLDKHFRAVGQENLLKKETYTVEAAIEQMGTEFPMTMKLKRPNKFRMEMEMQGQKMVQAYDGENGWMIAPWMSSEPQDLSGPELAQAMEQANFDGELYNYSSKGTEASLIGKVNLDGKPMYNIKLTDKNGAVKNYFIDTEDHLIRKVKARINAQGQEVEVEQNLSGYKEFDGVKMPSKIESKNPMGTAVIHFKEIEFNVPMDDSLFKKP